MRCALCRRAAQWENNPWRPFCSERCQVLDLGRWAAERYRVPGHSVMVSPSELDLEQPDDASGEPP